MRISFAPQDMDFSWEWSWKLNQKLKIVIYTKKFGYVKKINVNEMYH